MTKRSYDQPGCGLATALDLLGQRWTLLIVRELLVGSLRYTDLISRLNGIGTNLLAARLRHLETIDVVRRHNLPPPAASAVYQLTERGRSLEPILTNLALWGQDFVDAQQDAGLDARREAFALHCAFRADQAQRVDDTYQFEIENAVLHARVYHGRLQTGLGPIPEPKVTIRCDRLTWAALLQGGWAATEPAEGQASDGQPGDEQPGGGQPGGGPSGDGPSGATLDVNGDERAARRVFRIFGR